MLRVAALGVRLGLSALLCLSFWGSGSAAIAALQPGDLLIADGRGGGSLLVLPGAAGTPSVFSSGGWLWNVLGVAAGPHGETYVSSQIHLTVQVVVKIDPISGAQQVVSEGGLLTSPVGLAVGPDGTIYVADQYSGSILKVDPVSGSQTVLRNDLRSTLSIAMGSAGPIYATAWNGGFDKPLVTIDPVTGSRSTFFSVPDHPAVAVTIAPSGEVILLAERVVNNQLLGHKVYSIDPVSRASTVLADLTYGTLSSPLGIVVANNGAVFISGSSAGGVGILYAITSPRSAQPVIVGGVLKGPLQMAIYRSDRPVPTHDSSWGQLKLRYR